MRGASEGGSKSFKLPSKQGLQQLGDLLDILDIGELPVAPKLEPINDEWSISNFDDPVDAKDCAAYPASPYCDNDFIDPFSSPLGYSLPEIKSNGCETCVYIYPIIMWMKLQPMIICRRDPNCDKNKTRNIPAQETPDIPVIPDGYYLEVYCVRSWVQTEYGTADKKDDFLEGNKYYRDPDGATLQSDSAGRTYRAGLEAGVMIVNYQKYKLIGEVDDVYRHQEVFSAEIHNDISREEQVRRIKTALDILFGATTGSKNRAGSLDYLEFVYGLFPSGIPSNPFETKDMTDFWVDFYWRIKFTLIPEKGGEHFDVPPPKKLPPPPPPPPPKEKDDMCCNECRDANEKSDKLLKEIKEIKKALGSGKLEKALNAAVGIGDDSLTTIVNLIAKRIGTGKYPIEVPESLLTEADDTKTFKAESNADYLYWLTHQLDALVGEFPIDIEVKDIDPLKEGDQTKTITLPNIAEAIAEIYGLTIKSSVNQEVELNMLLRLAAEAIAIKNATVVTQDYARANAQFLGYKANFKPRELLYNFDFANTNLDPKSKEPIVLEKLLKTVKGYVQGWQIEDKETVVGFLQKLMFSAGIIKAVFFRGKKQQKELQREINSMADDEKAQEAKFEAFIKEINDPDSRFNKDSQDKPIIKDITPPDSKGAK